MYLRKSSQSNQKLSQNRNNIRMKFSGHEEIVLDICVPTDGSIRYSAYILEASNDFKTYACLIVPQGR